MMFAAAAAEGAEPAELLRREALGAADSAAPHCLSFRAALLTLTARSTVWRILGAADAGFSFLEPAVFLAPPGIATGLFTNTDLGGMRIKIRRPAPL